MKFRQTTSTSLAIGICLSLMICGCTSAPKQSALITADYGSYPENYEDVIREYLQVTLKDPYNMQDFSATRPQKGFFQFNLYAKREYGYVCIAQFNAKNSFGAYTGRSGHLALLRNGQVQEFKPLEEVSSSEGFPGAFGQGKHFYKFVDESKSTD